MKVIKFGGSSLSDGASFTNAINIITSDPERRVVVTSAPGKRYSDDIKVTDLLIKYAEMTMAKKDTTEIVTIIFNRYKEIGNFFGIADEELFVIRDILIDLAKADYPNNDYLMAAFKAHGERLNARLMAKILQAKGFNARFVDPLEVGLYVTGTPNNASVVPAAYRALRRFEFSDDEIIIFPGFFGVTLTKNIATFARGGSDITGAILARAFRADIYENFTDVDAIYSANPALVDNPYAIKKMTYREMRELSYAGFSVFHDEALIPAIGGNIPINVRNTNNPDAPGTLIVPENGFEPETTLTGIASSKNFGALYLHKYLLNKETGVTFRILEILNDLGISYEHMPSGIDDITIIFDKQFLTEEIVDELCTRIQKEIEPDRLEWIRNYAIIMMVGEGLAKRVGIIAPALQSLYDKGIDIQMVNQGASRISFMLGTKREDVDAAVKAIYDRFFNQEI